jgi:hypothetical protein
MSFFIHTLFMVSFVWMVFHFWQQLPLIGAETLKTRQRDFMEWTAKGVAAPLMVWLFMNLGLTSWLPPVLPEVDAAKNSGGFWLGAALRAFGPAMSVIVSFWAAISLVGLVLQIRQRTADRARFNGTILLWTACMWPVGGLILWISGGSGLGFAVVAWLAPIVHGSLPQMEKQPYAPSYSQAIAKLKFGKYSEAEWEIIQELEQCENDFNGWMMLAELYAVHFHDFKQAEQTVIDLCEQSDIQPSDACVALHRLADWYLQLQNDPQGARRCMEAIRRRYPKTHLDRMAALRLKRMPHTREEWLEAQRRPTVHLPALHDELDEAEGEVAAAGGEARQKAELYSQKLVRDPNDAAAREAFARALAQLDKIAAAIEQIDLLLQMQGQLSTRRAEWMGLKAAWMMKRTPESPEVMRLLRRIIRDFPNSAQAMAAQRRIFLLEERARVARFAAKRKRPRIVIRMDDSRHPVQGEKETGS